MWTSEPSGGFGCRKKRRHRGAAHRRDRLPAGAGRAVPQADLDRRTHAVSQWRAFLNRTGRDGIDGIGPVLPDRDASGNLLPTGGDVIVPDSPNGVVWRVSADGKTATQIASGMDRPVGAALG